MLFIGRRREELNGFPVPIADSCPASRFLPHWAISVHTEPSHEVNCPPMNSTRLCSALLLAPLALWAAAPEPDLNRTFKRMEVHIPMRDGVKLYTDIYIPKKSRDRLPFLFTRTPYGSTDDKGRNGLLPHSYKDFVSEGYIFVFQDIRGRY